MIWARNDKAGPIMVNVSDRGSLMADIATRFRRGDGFSIATLNLDHVVKLARDPQFHVAYAAHSHVTADGKPIVWLSRLAGQSVSLVPGSELIEPMVALAREHEVPVAFFGTTQATLDTVSEELLKKYPGLEVVLCLAPEMGFDPGSHDAEKLISKIGQSGARLVFIALGAPNQERFAARAAAALPDVGFLSVGAGLDFISGRQHRAPRWIRSLGAEWLWRLAVDPRRLAGRYAACIAILPRMTLQAWRIGKRPTGS